MVALCELAQVRQPVLVLILLCLVREHKLYGDEHSGALLDSDLSVDSYVKGRQEGFIKLYKKLRSRIEATRVYNANRYNLRRRPLVFNPGDKVWRKNKVLSNAANHYSAKLAPEYVGPFIVRCKRGSWSYELSDEFEHPKGVWYVQDLKPFYSPSALTDLADQVSD